MSRGLDTALWQIENVPELKEIYLTTEEVLDWRIDTRQFGPVEELRAFGKPVVRTDESGSPICQSQA